MTVAQIKKLMERKKSSKSGENGSVLIIGGSVEDAGSLIMTCLAAYRTGCDMVGVICPEEIVQTINLAAPEIKVHPFDGSWTVKNAKLHLKTIELYDAIVLGSGIDQKSEKYVQFLTKKLSKLKVVDSRALQFLSFKEFENCILTVNEQELFQMLTNSQKEFLITKLKAANAKSKAEILQGNLRYFLHNNNVILFKGPTDIIISRNKVHFNRTGNPGMTSRGTGDILAGLIGGFLGKTQDLVKAANAGSFINGTIADKIHAKTKNYSYIASDILADLEKI